MSIPLAVLKPMSALAICGPGFWTPYHRLLSSNGQTSSHRHETEEARMGVRNTTISADIRSSTLVHLVGNKTERLVQVAPVLVAMSSRASRTREWAGQICAGNR